MPIHLNIALDLGLAWLVGCLIGMEREFRGRPAGLRTHALVSVASALLMLATVHQDVWLAAAGLGTETVRTDPTRMAQGIMTGIGFLGGGVIFKDGLSVHGLTTAASIWMTAAIGILIGVGFYAPAAISTLIALVTLSALRWVETRTPTQIHARLSIRFPRESRVDDGELRRLLGELSLGVNGSGHRLLDGGAVYEFRTVVHTTDRSNLQRLADRLCSWNAVREFELGQTAD